MTTLIVSLLFGINLNLLLYLLGFDHNSLYMSRKNKIIYTILCLIPFMYTIMFLSVGLFIILKGDNNV